MKLSVSVPVYNMAADGKLEYCLDSLLHQTLTDMEVIAVDDASTDNSGEILRRYQQQYPKRFVAEFLPENHRQGGAKNRGLSISRGEFIGFVDSDDWVTPDCFEQLVRRAEETGADVAGCDFCYAYSKGMEPGERIPCNRPEQTGILDHDKKVSLFLHPGALVTKIYRRELFEMAPFAFPEHMFFEDNATGVELLRRATHFEYIEKPLYFYFQHSASTVHVVTKERCENRMEAMRIMVRYARENGYFEEFREILEYKFTNLFYQNTLFSYMQGCRHIDPFFVRRMGREMREYFPRFQENPYYAAEVHPEEKMWMRLQQRSTLLFVIYYKAKFGYRKRINQWRGRKNK